VPPERVKCTGKQFQVVGAAARPFFSVNMHHLHQPVPP